MVFGLADIGPATFAIPKTFTGIAGIFISLVYIIVPDAFCIGICKNRNRRIADHTAGVSVDQFPPLEIVFAAFTGKVGQRTQHFIHQPGVDNGLQGHLATKDVPSAENRTPYITTMYLPIPPGVTPIQIRQRAGIYHRMIQRSIKDRPLLLSPTPNTNLIQCSIPLSLRLFPHSVEIPTSDLSFQIFFGPCHIRKRDPRLHQHNLILRGGKLRKKAKMFSLLFLRRQSHPKSRSPCNALLIALAPHILSFPPPAFGDISTPYAIFFQRFAELCIEVDGIVRMTFAISPSSAFRAALHPTRDSMVIHDLNILRCGSPPYPAGQVDLDTGISAGWKGETQHSAMRRSRHLGPDSIAR